MKQRTCDIIMSCKYMGNTKYSKSSESVFNAVAKYLGDKCAFPWELYDYRKMEEIVLDAFYDFIDGADKPSYELRSVFDTSAFAGRTLLDRIFTTFLVTEVKDDAGYVNGFTEDLIKKSEEILGIGGSH